MSKLNFYISAFPTQVVSQNDRMMVTYSDGNVVDKGLIPGYADKELVDPYIDDKGYLKWFFPDETEHGNYLVRVDNEVEIVTGQVTEYGLYSGSSRTDLNDTYRTFKAAGIFLEDTFTPICLRRYWPDITTGNEVYVDGNGNRLTTSHPIDSASYALINLAEFTTNARHYFPANNDYAYYQWEFADAQVIFGVVASLWYSETSPWKFEVSNDGINWYLVKETPVKYDGNRFPTPDTIEGDLKNGMENSEYYISFDKPVTAKYLRMVAPQEGRSNQWRGIQMFVPITNLRNISFFLNYDEIYFDFNSFNVIESAEKVFIEENLKDIPTNAENAYSTESLFKGEVTRDSVVKYAEPIVFNTVSNTIDGLGNRFGGLVLPPGVYQARITGSPKLDLDINTIAWKGDAQYAAHQGVACGFVDEASGQVTSEIKFISAITGGLGEESIKSIDGNQDVNYWQRLFKPNEVGTSYFLGDTEMIIELDYHKTLTSFQFLSGYAYYQNIADIDIYTSDNGTNWTHLTKCTYRSIGRHALTDKELVNVRTKWIKIVPNNTAETRFGLTKIFIGTDDVGTASCEAIMDFEMVNKGTVTFRNFNKTSYNWKDVKIELYRTEFTNKAMLINVNFETVDGPLVDVISETKFNVENSIVNTVTYQNPMTELPNVSLTASNTSTGPNVNRVVDHLRNPAYQYHWGSDSTTEPVEIINEFESPFTFDSIMEKIGDTRRPGVADYKYSHGATYLFRAPRIVEIFGFNDVSGEWEFLDSIGGGIKDYMNEDDALTNSNIHRGIDGSMRTDDFVDRVFRLSKEHTYKKVKYVLHGYSDGFPLGAAMLSVTKLNLQNSSLTFISSSPFEIWRKVKAEKTASLVSVEHDDLNGNIMDVSDKILYDEIGPANTLVKYTDVIPPGKVTFTFIGPYDDSAWIIKGA